MIGTTIVVRWLLITLATASATTIYSYPKSGISSKLRDYVIHDAPWTGGIGFPNIGRNSQLLSYVPWSWDNQGDDTKWYWRINSVDIHLPPNLTTNGVDRVVKTAYALVWNGAGLLLNQVRNTSASSPPKFCVAFLNPQAHFSQELLPQRDLPNGDIRLACESLLGSECLHSLETALTKGWKGDCLSVEGIWGDDLPKCHGVWNFRPQDVTFVGDILADNDHTRTGNASFSPARDHFFMYQIQPHSASDEHAWWNEVNRTQVLMVREGDKPARLSCTTFRDYQYGSASDHLRAPVALAVCALMLCLMLLM